MLNLEVGKTELETYEKIDVDFTKREKPEVVQITEVVTEEQTPDKTIKKRTIKKKVGNKQEVTEIVTVHEENKEPETTITVVESEAPEEELEQIVEPEEVIPTQITEVLTEEQTPDKTIKKRTIKKKVGNKQEITEIVTVHEDNKEPETTITVVESEIPVEELDEIIEPEELEEDKSEPKKEPKTKKKIIKKKKTSDIDDELERLLNLEVEKTELETYEKIDVDLSKREKPESVPEVVVFKRAEIEEVEEIPTPKIKTPKKKPIKDTVVEVVEVKPEDKPEEMMIVEVPEETVVVQETEQDTVSEKMPKKRTIKKKEQITEPEIKTVEEILEPVPVQEEVEEPELLTPEEPINESIKEVKPKKKVIKKKKTSDMDDELERLLNLEVEKTELETYEKTDIDLAKREKPEIDQEPVLFKRAEKDDIKEVPEEKVLKITKKPQPDVPVEEAIEIKPKKIIEHVIEHVIVEESPQEVVISEVTTEEPTIEKEPKKRVAKKKERIIESTDLIDEITQPTEQTIESEPIVPILEVQPEPIQDTFKQITDTQETITPDIKPDLISKLQTYMTHKLNTIHTI